MRIHRNLFYITLAISVISLGLSICWNYIESIKNPFLSNVMLAVFGSGFLVMLSSIIGYFVEKRKYTIKYCSFARQFKLQTSDFVKYANDRNLNPNEVYREVNRLVSIFDSFAYEYSIDVYDYFLPNSKSKKSMRELQDSINLVRLDLLQAQTNSLYDIGRTSHRNHYLPDYFFNSVVDIENKIDAVLYPIVNAQKHHK